MKIGNSWDRYLQQEYKNEYWNKLQEFLRKEKKEGKQIYPPSGEWFRAFQLTPLENVKVVIIGQDPYHGPGQANGLSFSVKKGVKVPPSLKNIYIELERSCTFQTPNHGDLSLWAKQGVLMINAVLTVEAHRAGSHQKKGWESFTDRVVEVINDNCENVVFVLWGAFAKKKAEKLIDSNKHCILTGPHPSPLSAYRGFFGCNHFVKINEYLNRKKRLPIDWSLPIE
jgi:uracil-DNA glycosylase